MDTDWNAQQYLHFEQERTRPAKDLLTFIAHHPAHYITDLGCGPGNSTALLQQTWHDAQIIGIDNSDSMLTQAQNILPNCLFIQQNFTQWQPETAQDIIFANASLQWADDHAQLFPKFMQFLAPKGILAIQMPDNLQESSHLILEELAQRPAWKNKIKHPKKRPPLLSIVDYYTIFLKISCNITIWRTTYYHTLPNATAIAQWFSSTAMRPYLNCLDKQDDQTLFKQQYIELLKPFYPPLENGQIILSLPRLFIVAERKD